MKKFLKIVIPLIIIGLTAAFIYTIFSNPPKVKSTKAPQQKIEVEVQRLAKRDFPTKIDSFGVIDAATQTTLTSQVSGKIVYIDKNFKNGGHFKKGELLIKIEDDEYKADVEIAKSELLSAKHTLLEEEANAKQAKEDWKKLGMKDEPNDLVLRIPQLNSAKAALIAAEANLLKAKLNLKRTQIKAPYSGRVVSKNVSIAQVVSSNAELGMIFEDDSIEIRLPIKNRDLKFVDLNTDPKVELISQISGKKYSGTVSRSESTIDADTKQLYLIADINTTPKELIVGEYMSAMIEGKILKDAIVVPNGAIYQSSYVFVEKDGVLIRKDVKILWQNSSSSVILEGLEDGDNLVVTTLGLVSSGTKVKVVNRGTK